MSTSGVRSESGCACTAVVDGVVVELVECGGGIDDVALPLAIDAVRAAEVEHGVALGAELDALETAGQEAAVPHAGGDGLGAAAGPRGQDDEAGQVLALAAESIQHP